MHAPTGYGRADNGLRSWRDIIEYRARNGSQINVAITTGRPRVLHRSIIPPSITRIDLSRAASFVCPEASPRTNDSVAWQPFYLLAADFSPSRADLPVLAEGFPLFLVVPSKRKHLSVLRQARVSLVGGYCGETGGGAGLPPLNSSSGGGYYFPR